MLEVKNGQCVLFNGSFNVLSFDNVSAGRKVSREEMALVHHQVAISKHQEYIKTFTDIYSKRILDEINQSKNPKDVAEIKSDRIDYLYQISENKDIFVDFYTEYDEKTLQAKNTAWYEECEELMERINQFNANGSVDQNEFKTTSVLYQKLIKESVALTISSTTISELEKAYTNFEKLPKSKNKTKDVSNKNSVSSLNTFGSLSDQAMAIINASNFENERNVTLYVSALNFLYANRAFKNPTEGMKYLKKILKDSMVTSVFSVFDYTPNKNGKMLDITIGIGGYSFRLLGICPINMETKLRTIRIPKGTTRLENVNLKNLENTFKTLINK